MKRYYNCHGDICTRYWSDSSDLHITLAPKHQSSVFSSNMRLADVRVIQHVMLSSTLPPTYSYIHVCAQLLSCVQLFVTLWTVACQAPLSMGFYRQEYWSGLPWNGEKIQITRTRKQRKVITINPRKIKRIIRGYHKQSLINLTTWIKMWFLWNTQEKIDNLNSLMSVKETTSCFKVKGDVPITSHCLLHQVSAFSATISLIWVIQRLA